MNVVRFIVFLLLPLGGWATDYEPWIGPYGEVHWRNCLAFQHFTSPYYATNRFLNSSLSLTVKPDFSLEGEIVAANTRLQSGGIDHVRITGRYVWEDDVAGDPFTVTFGGGLIQTFDKASKDPSSFHHGHSEAEIFVTAGKEITQGEIWVQRFWGVFSLGCAPNRGSPWIRADFHTDKRLCGPHVITLYMKSLWGLGHQHLNPSHFTSYGPIQHQSIDLGIGYHYHIPFFGEATLDYKTRIHARNYPSNFNEIKISLLYTFGL
ncbi:MAG: hypothetical protein LW832_08820 [Parachlamydia sp.]|jgi:hypothetical protein|nr:hypothetical protein [Parachlamydia sp.]